MLQIMKPPWPWDMICGFKSTHAIDTYLICGLFSGNDEMYLKQSYVIKSISETRNYTPVSLTTKTHSRYILNGAGCGSAKHKTIPFLIKKSRNYIVMTLITPPCHIS